MKTEEELKSVHLILLQQCVRYQCKMVEQREWGWDITEEDGEGVT